MLVGAMSIGGSAHDHMPLLYRALSSLLPGLDSVRRPNEILSGAHMELFPRVRKELEARGIWVFSAGKKTLAEEMPEAYKNVDDVVEAVTGAGISRRVARLRPMGVVKG